MAESGKKMIPIAASWSENYDNLIEMTISKLTSVFDMCPNPIPDEYLVKLNYPIISHMFASTKKYAKKQLQLEFVELSEKYNIQELKQKLDEMDYFQNVFKIDSTNIDDPKQQAIKE